MKSANLVRKTQTMIEYAIILGVTVGALLTMFHFYGRSIQGKIKESLDSLGGQFVANSGSGMVVTPGHAYNAKLSSAMRRTSGGFLFHTGLLPLGMSISVSTGETTTTEHARIDNTAGMPHHPALNVPKYASVAQAEGDPLIQKAKDLGERYGGKEEIPKEAAQELKDLN